VDLCNLEAVRGLLDQWQPDAIIHTAAQARPAICQREPEATRRINVDVPRAIAALCAESSIPFVFTSTDQVFDGLNAPYRETDLVSPVSVYGQQKAEAEQRVFAVYPDAVVARMPLMFGVALTHATSFLQDFLKIWRSGETLNLFTDEYRTPVSNTTAAQGLLIALEKGQGELLHLGGKERLSRYEFGLIMADVFGLPQSGIHPCTQDSVPTGAPRSPDTSMVSTKAFTLGYRPPSIQTALESLKGKV
jgi:dTDP-4-dehydrorhamnose reductase